MTRKRNPGPSQRQLRVGEALRHALADILARGELRDPELANLQATVTEVRVSPDLRAATAFIVPFGGGDAAALAGELKPAGGWRSCLTARRCAATSSRTTTAPMMVPTMAIRAAAMRKRRGQKVNGWI